MSLNIKNEHVHELAREVARRTGKSKTGAIETALTRYLSELEAAERDDDRARRARVQRILDDILTRLAAAHASPSTDEMYDESGLPR